MTDDEPSIIAGSHEISTAWIDWTNRRYDGVLQNEWSVAILYGVAEYNQHRMMQRNWPMIAQAVRESRWSRLSGQFGETKAMFFSTAGRLLWTLNRGDHQISFLSYEHEHNDWWGGSIQSMECPLSIALKMIDDVATRDVCLIHDSEIGIA